MSFPDCVVPHRRRIHAVGTLRPGQAQQTVIGAELELSEGKADPRMVVLARRRWNCFSCISSVGPSIIRVHSEDYIYMMFRLYI
jgi:hypothetical protein